MNISVFSVQTSQRFLATLALFGVVFAPLANVPLAYAASVFTSSFELGATGNSSITSDNGWSLANNDWIITSGSGHSGSRKVQVSDQGPSDDILRKNYSTVGQNNVVLSYYYKTDQPLEANDHVYVEWTANGSTWTQLADYKSISNGSWTAASFNLPAGANNNANFAFRFRAVGLEASTGGGDKDEFQLDTVNLSTDNIPVVDVCTNIGGNQSSVPEGYTANDGICTPIPVDVCPNIDGAQGTVPEGYVLNDGQCVVVPPPVDVCPNLEGNQATVPEGYVLDDNQCVVVPPPVDACTNIDGLQVTVPEGYIADGDICTLPPVDVCPNLDGAQGTVPEGMQIADGQCIPIPPPDVCPNLDGAQGTVPEGYVLTDGQCVEVPPPPVDACPNIEGDQATVPEGMQIADGQCIPIPPPDVCPNLDGAQGSVPEGYVLTDGQCVEIPADACTNIEGNQVALPEGHYFASAGICLPNPVDVCSNLEGDQATVPEGYTLNDGQCIFNDNNNEDEEEEEPVMCTVTAVSNTEDVVGGDSDGIAELLSVINGTYIAGASWIWGDNPVNLPTDVNETQTFTKTFTWNASTSTITSAELEIAADNGFRVTLNGNIITDQMTEIFNYGTSETFNVSNFIVEGNNTLFIEVVNIGEASTTPENNPAGLLYKLVVAGDDETCDDASDSESSDRYTLDITITGEGEGNVQSEENILCFSEGQENDCSETYPAGAVVTLVATPNEGSNFDNSWTVGAGTCTGNTTPCTVTMNSNHSLIAHFDLNSSGGSGNGGTRVKRNNGGNSLTSASAQPLVLGEATSTLPVGAPNTGAGGTSNTVALPIFLAILEASREVRKK